MHCAYMLHHHILPTSCTFLANAIFHTNEKLRHFSQMQTFSFHVLLYFNFYVRYCKETKSKFSINTIAVKLIASTHHNPITYLNIDHNGYLFGTFQCFKSLVLSPITKYLFFTMPQKSILTYCKVCGKNGSSSFSCSIPVAF